MALTRQEADAVLGIDQPLDVEDVAFVAALRAGRPDAFERLVLEYQSQLYSLALRIVSDREDARDVVQEVFIKALRALPETHGKMHVRAWLYRVTINASYDHLRACKRRPIAVEDEVLLDRASPVDENEQAELVQMFVQTLRSLPRRQQVALLLKDVHGLPHSEIAEALGISRGSAEVLLFRARSGFRRVFSDLADDSVGEHCGFAERQAARAVGGGLPSGRRRQLLEHARTCPDCRRTLEGVGGAALGLAVAFPLVAWSGGTAAAAGITSAAMAGGTAGAAGLACGSGAAAAAGTGSAAAATGLGATAGTGLGAAAGTGLGAAAGTGLTAAGGAAASGIVAKLGALAGAKAAAAIIAGACVAAGGVAGVEIVKQDHGAADRVVQATAPVVSSTASPATITSGASCEATQTPAPAAVATSAAIAAAAVSPAAASPTAAVTVLAKRKARRSWTKAAIADLRRSPRGAFAAVVHRWRTAGLPGPSIDPLAGRVAWKRAMAVVRSRAGSGSATLADIHPPSQSAVAPVVGAQKKAGGKKVVPVTPDWQATLKTSEPTARPTPKARPKPHARPTHGGATPAHRPTPRPRPTTPRPEHTWQDQPTPVTTPSFAPSEGGADGTSLGSAPDGVDERDENGGEKADRSIDVAPGSAGDVPVADDPRRR